MKPQNLIQTIKQARKGEETYWLSVPGIVGIGTRYKIKKDKETDQLCMCIYVEKKESLANLPQAHIIPPKIVHHDGTEIITDVIETGKIYAYAFTQRMRPVPSGASIGHYAITAGTLGAVATDNATGKKVILSNNHVLANSNNAAGGDPILQPGPYDGGTVANDTIARLLRWKTIDFSGRGNLIDAAIAEPINEKDIAADSHCSPVKPAEQAVIGLLFAGSSRVTIINPIQAVLSMLNISLPKTAAATLRMWVHKCGRTTEYTKDRVQDIDATINVNYDGKVATFTNQILTGPMSQGGDSGSVVYAMPKGKRA